MNTVTFRASASKKIRSILAFFFLGILFGFIAYYFSADVLFRSYSDRYYPIFIGIAVFILFIAIAIYGVLVTQAIEIIVTDKAVIIKRGQKELGQYDFASYAFTSHITRYRTNGVVTNVSRKLIAYDGNLEYERDCSFLGKKSFEEMMALVENRGLHSFNNAYATNETGAHPESAIPTMEQVVPQQGTIHLHTENVKKSFLGGLKVALIVFAIIEVLIIGITYMDTNGFKRGSGILFALIFTAIAFFGILLCYGIYIISTVVNNNKQLARTPKVISISQTSISFDMETFVYADITAVSATPASYLTPATKPRTIRITSSSKGLYEYNLGLRSDPNDINKVVLSRDEYESLIYLLRQAFVQRPEVFRHDLENF